MACGGGPGRCPFTDTTVRQGNMAAPGVGERRSETETVIKSFFTHLTPIRKLFSVLSEGEEGGRNRSQKAAFDLVAFLVIGWRGF